MPRFLKDCRSLQRYLGLVYSKYECKELEVLLGSDIVGGSLCIWNQKLANSVLFEQAKIDVKCVVSLGNDQSFIQNM